MKQIIYLLGFILLSTAVNAQTNEDTIKIRYNLLGEPIFVYEKKDLKPKDLLRLIESNHAALNEGKKAKNNFDAALVFGYPGGFIVGYTLGRLIFTGKTSLPVLAVGVGLIGISVPFSIAYSKHAKKAVQIYNNDLKMKSTSKRMDLELGFCGNGISVKLGF